MLKKIKDFIQKHKYKILAGLGIASITYIAYDYMKNNKEVTLSAFLKAINLNTVKEISIQDKYIFFKSNQSDLYNAFIGSVPPNLIYQIIQNSKVPYLFKDELFQQEITNLIITMAISIVPLWFLVNQLKKSQISSENIKVSVYKNKQKFQDYYGGQKIKHKLKEVIDFLKNSQKYQKMGARMRRGILFYGPPGTGKTLLARALANEAGCEFIKVVASEFQEIFVGVGPKRVRQLFGRARACQNGCIIFIDQIDGFGSRLNHLRDSHQTTSTINQLLTQMDGFLPNHKIVVVAATNRIDLVDSAILRAGRFDIKVNIGLPNKEERIGILNRLLVSKVKKYEASEQLLQYFGNFSDKWCGADIELLINQSIYKAIRDKSQILTSNHIRKTLDQLSIQK